jgi:hypothetical protein
VNGWEFQKTTLPPESHRGEVLTMASVLKVTANGRTTSPVRATKEDGETLLDRTIVFFSNNLGDVAKHTVKNMPVLLGTGRE